MPRIFFTVLSFFHGVIHIMGCLREWKIPGGQNLKIQAIVGLSESGAKVIGSLWLFSGVGMLLSTLLFLMDKKYWWIVGSFSLIISQLLVILYWHDAKYGTLINLIIVVGILLSYHQQDFSKMVKREIDSLIKTSTDADITTLTADAIKDLPPIVQKWLIRSNAIGREKTTRLHLKQRGMLRTKPDGKWMEMEAEQYIAIDKPGFIWKADIYAGYSINLNGRDKFANGHGEMLIKAIHTIPIANSSGPEIDQGAMMRYLAEIIWAPSAAVHENIRWSYINETTARANLTIGDQHVSGNFSFDTNGDVTGFEGKRYADLDNLYSLETWAIAIKGYKNFNSFRIANKCEVTWKLRSGDFTWLQLEIIDMAYNRSARPVAQQSCTAPQRSRQPARCAVTADQISNF